MKPVKPVKRVEIVVESHEVNNVIEALDVIGVTGYSIFRQVGGRGERGERRPGEFAYDVENDYLIVACTEVQAEALVAAIRPMLVKFGGMCLVSDATWVCHTGLEQ